MNFSIDNKDAYNSKILDVMASRTTISLLQQAVGNIESIARATQGDRISRQYTVRKTLLTGSRGGQVNIGANVKPAMGLVKQRETFDIGYGELFVEEDVRNIKDGIITEEEITKELLRSLTQAHDAAYIGDSNLFSDNVPSIERPITVNSSLISLTDSIGANSDSSVNWSLAATSLEEIYSVLTDAIDELLKEGLTQRNIDTLYISDSAYRALTTKPYASDNQIVANKLASMGFTNIVRDPMLNKLSSNGTLLGACLFMFDSRDIKWYTDLLPTILDGSPTRINNTFTLGAEVRTGGIHNVSQYNIPVYRVQKLLG